MSKNTTIYLDDSALKQQATTLLKEAVMIDVRSAVEYGRGHIPGSINIPLESLKYVAALWHDKTIVFYCRSGNRTCLAKQTLDAIDCQARYVLKGGFNQWQRCGFEVERNPKAPLPIMQQVQIVVSIIILLGLALAVFVSPYFLLLDAFIGVGLLFAGLTGFCGMAKVLMLLPYNRA